MTITSPSVSPSPSPTSGLTPSEEATNAAATVPTGTEGTKKKGLTGAPVGTKVVKGQYTTPGPKGRGTRTRTVYGETQYASGDGAIYFANLDNQEKINLLINLAKIPGLYSRNKAPSEQYLISQAAKGVVAIRPEDITALESVMRYADTVGEDVDNSVVRLVTNPDIAKGFFDASGARTGAAKITVTPADALALELEQSFLDYLDLKASKEEKNEYAKKVNELEKKRKGALTSLERQQLLLDTVQGKAQQIFKDGIDEADSLLMRKGALGGTYNLLSQTYKDYAIPVDDKTLYKQAISSIRSKQALDNTINKIRLQAEVAMPAIKQYIQQGLSPREALGSYVGLYSKLIGVPENQVDLTKLAPVYSGDKVMPYQDWQKYLYTLPEYKQSPLYKNQLLGDARALINNFIGQVEYANNTKRYTHKA